MRRATASSVTCAAASADRWLAAKRQPLGAVAGISRMRRLFGIVLLLASSLAALTSAARAQSSAPLAEAGNCFGFSFGQWSPALDWHASGHAGTPAGHSSPLAPGGREWAAAPISPTAEGMIILFPAWWPAGVSIALPAGALAPGDTAEGRATAMVANGSTASSAAVRAWRVRCGDARVEGSTRGAVSGATPPRSTGATLAGTWRGTSTCLSRKGQPCGSDSVVYRIAAIADTTDSVSLATSTLHARAERPAEMLRCRYDAFSFILSCDTPNGLLRLSVRGTGMGGRLTGRDGVDLRYVHVRRAGGA